MKFSLKNLILRALDLVSLVLLNSQRKLRFAGLIASELFLQKGAASKKEAAAVAAAGEPRKCLPIPSRSRMCALHQSSHLHSVGLSMLKHTL